MKFFFLYMAVYARFCLYLCSSLLLKPSVMRFIRIFRRLYDTLGPSSRNSYTSVNVNCVVSPSFLYILPRLKGTVICDIIIMLYHMFGLQYKGHNNNKIDLQRYCKTYRIEDSQSRRRYRSQFSESKIKIFNVYYFCR